MRCEDMVSKMTRDFMKTISENYREGEGAWVCIVFKLILSTLLIIIVFCCAYKIIELPVSPGYL